MSDTSLIENLAIQKLRERNNQTYMNAISKMTEKIIMKRVTLQLGRGETLKPPDVNMSAEQFLTEQKALLDVEEEIEKQKQDKLIEEKGYKEKTDYTFITINPKDQYIGCQQMKQEVDKIIEKTKWINENEYAYVIEQRGKTIADTHGVHCHLLVHCKDKPNNEIRREMKNKVKHLVDMAEVKKFDIGKNKKGPLSICPTAEPINRLRYMLDWKKDPDKHCKQIVDKEMREKYNLDKIYYSGELLSQLIIGHQECQEEEKDMPVEDAQIVEL